MPSSDKTPIVLSFSLDPLHYDAAQEAWKGKKNLVFMGHDPSFFASDEQRFSFKIEFDKDVISLTPTS